MTRRRRSLCTRGATIADRPVGGPSRPLVVALASTALGVTVPAGAAIEALDIRHERWTGYRLSETLPDGSSLVEYGGETASLSSPEIVLRVGFVPRFACNVIVAVYGRSSVGDALGVTDSNTPPDLEIRIDGEPVGLPLTTDIDGSIGLYFRADVEALAALREQIDSSDIATFRPSDGEAMVFSLFGSTAVLGATETLCLAHEPNADVDERVDDLTADTLRTEDDPSESVPDAGPDDTAPGSSTPSESAPPDE